MSEEGEGGFYTKAENYLLLCWNEYPRYFQHGVGTTEGFPRNSTVKAYR
jgi:hypothetical protein